MTSASPSTPGAFVAGTATPFAQERPAGLGRRVTDAPTRAFHALLALAFLGGWITGDSESWRALHASFGYVMGGLVAWRVVYGLAGPRHARLGATWRRLAGSGSWLVGFVGGGWRTASAWSSARHRATALSTLLILAIVLPLALSGYAIQNEWLGGAGGDLLEGLHEGLANALMGAVVLHLGTLLVGSLGRRENLARPMLNGRVPGRGPDLVSDNRPWMAALMLACVVGLFAWQWQASPQGLLPTAESATRQSEGDDD